MARVIIMVYIAYLAHTYEVGYRKSVDRILHLGYKRLWLTVRVRVTYVMWFAI